MDELDKNQWEQPVQPAPDCKDEGLRTLLVVLGIVVVALAAFAMTAMLGYDAGFEKGEALADSKYAEGFQEAAVQCQAGYQQHMQQFHSGAQPQGAPLEFYHNSIAGDRGYIYGNRIYLGTRPWPEEQ